jgi:ABC-2 type transport system ATP-binding protein
MSLSSLVAALPGAFAPPPSRPAALSFQSVTHRYGSRIALDRLDLDVAQGEVLALLGPNGAGKSTAMKIALGIVKPDAGVVRVLGSPIGPETMDLKRQVGYVPENPSLYEFLTASEYLDFIADMYDLPTDGRAARVGSFLSGLELAGHENAMISGYSQGMKQKVALIAALLHRPRLLVLDEPLNGLDPRSARIVKELLSSLAHREGVGILFSTHVLEIAQAICDRIVIVHQGSVLATGTVEALRSRAGLPGSGLEEVFLSLTGTAGIGDIVSALSH